MNKPWRVHMSSSIAQCSIIFHASGQEGSMIMCYMGNIYNYVTVSMPRSNYLVNYDVSQPQFIDSIVNHLNELMRVGSP